ncbi:MAG: hypothetical protein R8G66_16545 [Cytophagales bacterium]|nr:hypothetical protein [Cytophagales bacterium]
MQIEKFNLRQFILIALVTSIWINASEIFRYFVFVMPMTKDYWQAANQAVAEMNVVVFSIWGLWDILLTGVLVFVVWLYGQVFGSSMKSILTSATLVWAAVFVIFWVASANMGLSNWEILLVALPLSWIEMVIGGWIATRLYDSGRWA